MVNFKLIKKSDKTLGNINNVINRILSQPITNHPGTSLDLIH